MLDQSYYDHLPDYADLPPLPKPYKPTSKWHPRPGYDYTLTTCSSFDLAITVFSWLMKLGINNPPPRMMMRLTGETDILIERPQKIQQIALPFAA